MSKVVGLIMVIGGIVFGVWAGIWWAFIGGIVDLISAVRAPELSAMAVAIGVAKILFASLIGWVAGLALVVPGMALIGKD